MRDLNVLVETICSPLPEVAVNGQIVSVEWDAGVFHCTADVAHTLSDRLFQAAVEAEGARGTWSDTVDGS